MLISRRPWLPRVNRALLSVASSPVWRCVSATAVPALPRGARCISAWTPGWGPRESSGSLALESSTVEKKIEI